MVVPVKTGICFESWPIDLARIMLDGVLSRSLIYSGLMCGEAMWPSYWTAWCGLLGAGILSLAGLAAS